MAKTYRKIPGVGTGRFGFQVGTRQRLYQGPDHLLVVQSTGYTEDYRRIFFRDILYVDVRPSRRRLWHAVISGIVIALASLTYFTSLGRAAFFLVVWPGLWLVVNLFRGPSCDCYVTTGVQTLKLPTPRRRRKIAPFISFLREKEGMPAAETPGAVAGS